MQKCPICTRTAETPMDLAKHMIVPTGNQDTDDRHRDWIRSEGLDLSQGLRPLAELLEFLSTTI